MCVRTKTSWGCGHEFKTTNECHSSRCQGLERYHYEKGRDCRNCKEGGYAITRGREGKGRYAQGLSRRNHSAESSNESFDVGSGVSPWANPNKREKEWHSPSRMKADDAWLQEHVDRNSDLQTIRESISGSDRASSTVHSPIGRTEKVYEYEEDLQQESDDYEYHRRPSTASRALKIELRSTHGDYDRGSRRPTHDRRRQSSQESFGSPHSSTEYQHRRYKPGPASHTTYEHHEPYDSGYGSYSSRNSPGQHSHSHGHTVLTAKTEPYRYSPEPRVVTMKPYTPPPMSSYGTYHTGFGVRGVNVVTRAPSYAYTIPRH
ncbi:hypothetical protein EDD37DRAFT_340040 [Exophiala viscosa]|uniref:Uncharacterized protein n=1 Tax=Exophiala viscosa TaxID=2486360 RepID=A0AAN6DV59_9EURO|nr:hypothetical protein EDD36DRAFT_259793 [Exophiala viscosa]KAI1626335.1 hypothetical protein EDD37DRAFT_340040 [Exophiala viscosa]